MFGLCLSWSHRPGEVPERPLRCLLLQTECVDVRASARRGRSPCWGRGGTVLHKACSDERAIREGRGSRRTGVRK